MILVDIIGLLAVLQLLVFGMLVGRARGKYGVKAPAITGNPVFERFYRVQMNTVETLIVFLPSLWLAAKYWSPRYVAILGAIYLVGRVLYGIAYVSDPQKRGTGFMLSMVPTVTLLIAALIGAIRALVQN